MNIIPDGHPIGGSDRRSGPAYPFGNDPAKIERYRRFWAREPVERPLVGFSLKTWFPMYEFAASRAWQGLDHLTPDFDVNSAERHDPSRGFCPGSGEAAEGR